MTQKVRSLPPEGTLGVTDLQRLLGYKSRRSVYNVAWFWNNVDFYRNGRPRWRTSTWTRYQLEHRRPTAAAVGRK